MELINSAKKLLSQIANGNMAKAIKTIKWQYFYKSDLRKSLRAFSNQGSKTNPNYYENSFNQTSNLVGNIIKLKSNIKTWLITGTIPLLLLGAIFTDVYEHLKYMIWPEEIIECEFNSCEVVVTTFKDQNDRTGNVSSTINEALNTLDINATYCPIPEAHIAYAGNTDFIEEHYVSAFNNNGTNMVLSGAVTKKDTLEIKLFYPPSAISKELSMEVKTKLHLEDNSESFLKSFLDKGFLADFIKISLGASCNYELGDALLNKIAAYDNESMKEWAYVFLAEKQFEEGDLEDSEYALKKSLSIKKFNKSNYARLARVQDTLHKVVPAFENYSLYIAQDAIKTLAFKPHQKVRKMRYNLIKKEWERPPSPLFETQAKRNKIINALKNDIAFYKKNNTNGIDFSKRINFTEVLIKKITNETPIIPIDDEANETSLIYNGLVHNTAGKPINNATITSMKNNAIYHSDDNGRFTIKAFPGDVLKVTANKHTESVRTLGESTNIKVLLIPDAPSSKMSVSGKVVDQNNRPLSKVSINERGSNQINYTDDKGNFSFTIDKPMTLYFSRNNYQTEGRYFDKSVLNKMVTLQVKTRIINGLVMNKSRQKLTNAKVSAVLDKIQTTTSSGAFKIEVPVNTQELLVSYPNYKSQTVPLTQKDQVLVYLDKIQQGRKQYMLSGNVVDINGKPISKATIYARKTEAKTISDKNGKFSILVDPISSILIEAPKFSEQEIKIKERKSITVKLQRESRIIKGIVYNPSGEPLIGANVLIKGTATGTITDFNGRFSLKVNSASNILVASYTGYTNKEQNISNNNQMKIVLNKKRTLRGY